MRAGCVVIWNMGERGVCSGVRVKSFKLLLVCVGFSKSIVVSESVSVVCKDSGSEGVMCNVSESVSVVCDSFKEFRKWLESVSFKILEYEGEGVGIM